MKSVLSNNALAGSASPTAIPSEIDAPGGWHGSALGAAAHEGHDGLVKLLLEEGANINVTTKHKSTGRLSAPPLQAAALNGHETTVLLLLTNKADVNKTGGLYHTALQAAALRGH